jgi:putative addiction module component (TIGR02574 family)
MTDKARILIDQARALSPEERIEIAEALVASVVGTPDGDVEAAWDAEIEARISALDRGEVALLDADEVLAELRRRLGQQ